jgi:hypothetical protein
MKQTWIIADEWSEYHQNVARTLGFALSHVSGMLEIVSTSPDKFASNEDAREYVVAHEHDTTNSIFMLAINAIIMGNMGKV